MRFLRMPGMDALYSGDETMNPSVDSSLERNRSAPAGIPEEASTSPSYEGQSKSLIVARTTVPPAAATTEAASVARRSLSEPLRKDAPKMRYVVEHGFVFCMQA